MSSEGARCSLTVLVAEDEANIAMALEVIVRGAFDCERVDVAGDGQAAWERLSERRYDALIVDWNMPRMTGQELLEAVRGDPRTRALPVLMLTARSDTASVQAAVEAGVNDYVVKPFQRDALVAKLDRLLGRNRETASSHADPFAWTSPRLF